MTTRLLLCTALAALLGSASPVAIAQVPASAQPQRPAQAQRPAPVPRPAQGIEPLSAEWRDAYQATKRELTASIVDVEDQLNAARRAEAWSELDCGLARVAELRTLRDHVDESAVAIDQAQREGNDSLARHHWLGLVTARMHGEVIAQEASRCGGADASRERRVVVRVVGPDWEPDDGFGAPRHAGSPATF